ncbi:IclR family transcriptional regulator [Pseudorhodoferax sp.]|uniref:IclR family transcriptional regulator n=1 Tax=Pseudorhodoferax sp. TaxID=1993553 RepID=UPI0039E31A0D
MTPASTSAAGVRTGTQSIERAVRILREVAMRGSAGWDLQELAARCALNRPTVHRILRCLVEERLVEQRASDKRYLLGPLNFELGFCVDSRTRLVEEIGTAVQCLARRLPKMAVLSVLRSGDDCICVARAGRAASEAAALRVGRRVALLSRSSGVAIAAALPPREARALCARSRQRLTHLSAEHLARAEELIDTGRQRGYVLASGALWHGVHSLSVVFGPVAEPLGSVTIAGWGEAWPAGTVRALLAELQPVAQAITAAQAALSAGQHVATGGGA